MSLTDLSAENAEKYSNRYGSDDEGKIEIRLDDDEMADVREVARARNQSYVDGRTTDTNYADDEDGFELHERGILAEKAMALLWEEAELDRSVSAQGDDGVDCQLEIVGELVEVDVKSSKYTDPDLLCKRGFDHEEADVYVNAHVDVDTGLVRFLGYVTAAELLQDENLQESYAPNMDHLNYVVEDDFDEMPEPNTGRDFERV